MSIPHREYILVYLLLLYIRTAVLCQQQSEGRVCRQHLLEPTAVQ